MENELIFTSDDCAGCNRCIASCPVMYVNKASKKNGKNHVAIQADACIHCGNCIKGCSHLAREYSDDTKRFFRDLSHNENITLLVAPSFFANYPKNAHQILGYLKSRGVKSILSVGFGANITTWGYINYIHQHNKKGAISQACPVVVDYIEKYAPELLDNLVPIHSPVMCSAIYLKKYGGNTDKLALLSPCVAKKAEIDRKENNGLINYNITFSHLMKEIEGIDISTYNADFDHNNGLGMVYPMPGGLAANVRHFIGNDAIVRQVEGELVMPAYLQKFAKMVKNNDELPTLVDALNCSMGCLYGTGVEDRDCEGEKVLLTLLKQKTVTTKEGCWSTDIPVDERLRLLNEQFSMLNLNDFVCDYTNNEIIHLVDDNDYKIQEAYHRLHKYNVQERTINCGACGYKTCHNMAVAIAEGYNYEENCVYYLKYNLEREKNKLNHTIEDLERVRSILKMKAETDAMTGVYNRHGLQELVQKILKRDTENEKFAFGLLDLDGLKMVNDTFGHFIGDEAIKLSALALKESLRKQDDIARIGGDEFVFILRGVTSIQSIKEIAERALHKVKKYGETIKLELAASIGVSVMPDDGTTFEDLYNKADIALYEAKSKIYDKVVIYNKKES